MIKAGDHVKVTGTGAFPGKTGFVKSVKGDLAEVGFDGDFAFAGQCRLIDLSPCPVEAPRKDEE